MTIPTRISWALPRWAGLVGVVSIAMLATASIAVAIGDGGSELFAQGPIAVDPAIPSYLARIFDSSILAPGQRVLHVLGIALFVGLAVLLVVRREASDRAPLAALTLAAVGTALFAPLELLPAGSTVAAVVGAVTPSDLSGFWGSIAGIALLAFLGTFPDGRWTPAWFRWVVATAALSGILTLAFPGSPADPSTWPSALLGIWLVGFPILALSGQFLRWRRAPLAPASRPVVVSLVVALSAFMLLWVFQPELTPGVLDLVVVTPRSTAVYEFNILLVLTAAVTLFPVSVSFAIVRYRLFDVDLLINRALVYGTVTALVAGIFLTVTLGVGVFVDGGFGQVIPVEARGPTGVVVGAFVVLIFQPLRRRVQRGVDRRFYRQRYDAQQLIDGFSAEAARVVDPSQLESQLLSVIERALHPRVVELHSGPFPMVTASYLEGVSSLDLAIEGDGEWRQPFHPDSAVLVPLVAGGSLTAVLELGTRTSASRYSALDLELLDRLAQAVGPALQLAHEVEARERQAKDRERSASELELARKIQQGLLPQTFPEIAGWSFDAFYQPAREVGGDFYDWFDMPDGRLAVVIGDVSDKGIPAALVMATCRTLLRTSGDSGRAPGDLLAQVNNRLHPDIPPGMFVTCQLIAIEKTTGRFTIANAGHNLPMVSDGEKANELSVRGMPLGLMPDMFYEEIEGRLNDGETFVLSSDGFTEAHSPGGEMFESWRMRDSLLKKDQDLVRATLNSHATFVGPEWDQEDDMTLVTVGRDMSRID
ncbi:MAG: GAF domain-containing SpoIIE family protein phosphatase [Acidimicrobiia bacterium]